MCQQKALFFVALLLLPDDSAVIAEQPQEFVATVNAVAAQETSKVTRSGNWHQDRFRFASTSHLHSTEHKAALTYRFDGTGIAVRLGGHNVPAYGPPSLGSIAVSIDDTPPQILHPRALPREFVVARNLPAGPHTLRLEHLSSQDGAGVRVESFRSWEEDHGELLFHVSGEQEAFLVDARAILRRENTIIRNTLIRNWLTGQCALTGLPPGDNYTLEIQATGWRPFHSPAFRILPGEPTSLPPVYLRRDASTVIERFRFPRLNQPAIRRPGESFRARFLGFDTKIDEVRLTRQAGTAVISRVLTFEEDRSAAYYYDREVVATLPNDMPPGTYDLAVKVTGGRRTGICRSPRSVHVVQKYPSDPVFVTFGHLDTSAQYQSEYLSRLVAVTNLLAPDMVLCSNAVNPAYVSGALAELDMPYVITFGNHQFPGHEAWYGDPTGLVDFGPHLSVLNFGHPWHTDIFGAEAMLASRPDTSIRVINAFEPNAPLDFLNRFQVRMIHDAHGTGKKVMNLGTTPTRRIGKTNSESFRIVRFRDNQVAVCTYNGHETAPVPFGREAPAPLSVTFQQPNDGSHFENTATVTNRLRDACPNGRVTFVMPDGSFEVTGGRLESQTSSTDGRFQVVSVRVDIPAADSVNVVVQRVEP